MSGTPLPGVTEWYPEGVGTQTPPGLNAYLQASAPQITMGQLATFDASGNVASNDGTVANQIAAGVFDEKGSETSTIAAVARAHFWEGVGYKQFSTAAGDTFVAADIGGVPAFIKDENTIGKLSNTSGAKRSFAGLAFGLAADGLTARFWGGRLGQLLARTLHALNNESAGEFSYAADASATTDLGTLSGSALATIGFVIPRKKRIGVIGSVEIIPNASQATAGTNYRTIQIWKVDTTGVVAIASSPIVATYTSNTTGTGSAALTAGQPTAMALGAASALNLLETDILVGTSIHTGGSGLALSQLAIRANFKVI
jgi:hypothetical protein